MSHTPGPWIWEGLMQDPEDEVCLLADCLRSESYGGVVLIADESSDAVLVRNCDVSLIAAAPDLLEACKALLEARGNGSPYEVVGQDPQTGHPLNAEGLAVVRLEAAIAKAEGREPCSKP